MYDKRYEKALEFARKKHKGQLRIGGDEYITHPIAVAEYLKNKGYGEDYQITALFHDLLEDTDATECEIETLAGSEVLLAVKLLSKKAGCDMAQYITGIKGNKMAFAVKTADRLHNLKCAVCTPDSFKRRYIKETKDWYMDFSPEIVQAVEELAATL